MNNNFFALGRYLRDYGYSVCLFLFDHNLDHFTPQCDTYDRTYASWVKKLTWGSADTFLKTRSEKIKSDLHGFNVIIGSGLSPAFLIKSKINIDIFIPYGSDIFEETHFRITKNPLRLASVNFAHFYQRKSLKKCNILNMTITNSLYENYIQKLMPDTERWFEGVPMVHAPTYDRLNVESYLNKTTSGKKFLNLRRTSDFLVISHMRQKWGGRCSDPNQKGNDILLLGWKKFVTNNPNVRSKLILFEYGDDVSKTKSLINKLNLNNHIYWEQKMSRNAIIPRLKLCDLVCGEFKHSWVGSGVIYEALVSEKPLLAYRNDSLYHDDLYPILNANNPDKITEKLSLAVADQSYLRHLGIKGRKYYDDVIVGKTIEKVIKYIKARDNT